MDLTKDPYAAFEGMAGQLVELAIADQPGVAVADARKVIVRTLPNESRLRYRAWIEANRKKVDDATNGRCGYIYVPDTGRGGQNELMRQFQGQFMKEALVIDERWNGGGQIPTRFIELLNRPITNYWARRDGRDWSSPWDGHVGPKVMLINGTSGSGGDAFPAYFRKAGLGKLIGTRTWGGLVGISGNAGLIDGGYISVPTFGYYDPDGTWGIEGYGVDPDIEVVDRPELLRDGGDPQLDRAIKEILAELKANPPVAPKRPEPPVRPGVGIDEKDR
jgi:tricorn protease